MLALRDLSLGKKLAALLLLFVAGVSAYIGFVFQMAHDVRAHTRQAGSAWPLLLQVGTAGRLTTEMRDAYAVAVTSQDADMLEGARAQAAKVQAIIASLVADARANGIPIDGLTPAFAAYGAAADAWASAMIEGGDAAGAAQSHLYELSQRQNEFTQQLDSSRQAINLAFEARLHLIESNADRSWRVGLFGGIALSLALLLLNSVVTRRVIVQPLQQALAATERIADGQWDTPVAGGNRDELGQLLAGIEKLRVQLKARWAADQRQDEMAAVLAELNLQMRGDLDVRALCENVIRYLTPRLGCEIGLIYVAAGNLLQPLAAYALRLDRIKPVALGHSLVGQVARSGLPAFLHEVPAGYANSIATGSVDLAPRNVAILPVQHDGELLAILELGALAPFDEDFLDILNRCCEHFAVVLKVAQSRRLAAGEGLRNSDTSA